MFFLHRLSHVETLLFFQFGKTLNYFHGSCHTKKKKFMQNKFQNINFAKSLSFSHGLFSQCKNRVMLTVTSPVAAPIGYGALGLWQLARNDNQV
jgi:hypothetical protein